METSYQEYWMELIRQLEMQQARYLDRMLGYDAEKMNEFLSKIPVGGGGGRTGKIESKNGIEERKDNGEDTFTLNDDQRNEVESNIELVVDDNTKDPDNIRLNFWQKFWDANSEMTQEEYEYYTCYQFHVKIMGNEEFKDKYKDTDSPDRIGSSLFTDNKKELYFPESIFNDKFDWNYGTDLFPSTKYQTDTYLERWEEFDLKPLNLTSVIQHEFGHGFTFYMFGSVYNSWDSNTKENWAITYVNWSYRVQFGIELERFIYK